MTPTVKRLTVDTSVLIVIDVQDKLLVKIPTAKTLVQNAAFLLDVAALLGVPTRATEQYPKGLGPTTAELARRLPATASCEDRVQLLRGRHIPGRTRNAPPAERGTGRHGNARLRRANRARSRSRPGYTCSSRWTPSRPAARSTTTPRCGDWSRRERFRPRLKRSRSSGSGTPPIHSSRRSVS